MQQSCHHLSPLFLFFLAFLVVFLFWKDEPKKVWRKWSQEAGIYTFGCRVNSARRQVRSVYTPLVLSSLAFSRWMERQALSVTHDNLMMTCCPKEDALAETKNNNNKLKSSDLLEVRTFLNRPHYRQLIRINQRRFSAVFILLNVVRISDWMRCVAVSARLLRAHSIRTGITRRDPAGSVPCDPLTFRRISFWTNRQFFN